MTAERHMMRSVSEALLIALFLGLFAVLGAVCPAYALDDGVYTVNGRVEQAGSDNDSMANAAIEEPLTLVESGGKTYLIANIKPVTMSGLTAYLGYLAYYPTQHDSKLAPGAEPVAILPQGYYDTVDGFNAAQAGDAAMRGMKYPKSAVFEVDPSHAQTWLQMYIPLLGSFSAGGGTQQARLVVDYGSARPVADVLTADAARSAVTSYVNAATNGRQMLYDRVYQASMQLLRTDAYTGASLSRLRSARDAAQAVCENPATNGRDSMDAMLKLVDAQQALKKKSPKSASKSSAGKKSNGTSSSKERGGSKKSVKSSGKRTGSKSGAPDSAKSSSQKTLKLDFAKLPDGTYTLYGEMIKADRTSQSVSDGAIDHNVRLVVKGGSYTVELTFKPMEMSGKTGALGNLWYFKSGYRENATGVPSGSYAQAKTLTRFSVGGKSYPKKVSFPLIPEARSNGWVPLRMYVPIIDTIAKGAGIQEAYLKLDRSSVVSGEKQVATSAGRGSGPGASSVAAAAASAAGSDGGSSGGSDSGSSTLASMLGDADSGNGDGADRASAGGAAAGSKSASAKGAAGGSTDAQTASTAQPAATGDQEPPLKRYIGLIIGIPALVICLYCAYVLFTRRGQLQVLRRSRS